MNNNSFNTILIKLGVNNPAFEAFQTEGLNLWGVELSGELAHKIWNNLKTELGHINHCPVIISDIEFLKFEFTHNYERWTEKGIIKSANYWEDFIQLSAQIDVEQWLLDKHIQAMKRGNYTDLIAYTRENYAGIRYLYDEDDLTEEEFLIGFVPEIPLYPKCLYNDRTEQFYEKVTILFVPTLHTWQIPAYFLFGAFNDCPPPQYHCAIWQYWQEKYGAEIIGMGSLEASIKKLPATWEEALELAQQHYYYCTDVLQQTPSTIEALAKYLQQSYYWHFWWD
jgi:hypothetical protein